MNELATFESNALAYTPSQYSTIQATDIETKKTVLNAINASESLSQMGDAVIGVIGIITQPGVRRSRDKNMPDAPCTNTILVCADGKSYFTQSEGIRRSADMFMQLGLFDDGEVVKMRVKAQTMANGNTIKSLELV